MILQFEHLNCSLKLIQMHIHCAEHLAEFRFFVKNMEKNILNDNW